MKLLLCFLGLLLSGVSAQKDVDVEGLREILLRLLSSGHPVTSESLNAVSQSFSGVEKDILTRHTLELQNAKEAEELVLLDEILDMETFKNMLFNLKALGVTVTPKVAETVLGVIDDPSVSALRPIVAAWTKANAVALTDALKSSIDATSIAIRQVIAGTTDTVRQRLKSKIASLPNGLAKTVLTGLDQDLEKISRQQGNTFTFSEDGLQPLSAEEIKRDSVMVNKILNREIVQFLSNSITKLTKAQAKQQVELLMRKVYDNTELPAVLDAVYQTLK